MSSWRSVCGILGPGANTAPSHLQTLSSGTTSAKWEFLEQGYSADGELCKQGLGRGWGRGSGGGEEQSLLGGRNYPPAHSQLSAERGCILTPPPVPKGTGGSLSSPPWCLRVHSQQLPLPWGWGESPGWPTTPGKACLLTSFPLLQVQVASALNLS